MPIEVATGARRIGPVTAHDLIDTDTGLRVGFEVVCPEPWQITVHMGGATYAFSASDIAALSGRIMLDTPQEKAQLYEGEPDSVGYPLVSYSVKRGA